jgi:hypothetical protein
MNFTKERLTVNIYFLIKIAKDKQHSKKYLQLKYGNNIPVPRKNGTIHIHKGAKNMQDFNDQNANINAV